MDNVVIHWRLDGHVGHGAPMKARDALEWLKWLNARFGSGTHWIQPAEDM